MTMDRMECRASLPQTIGIVVLLTSLACALYLLTRIREPIPIIIGWVGAFILGFVAIRVLFQLLRGDLRIIISDLGIDDRRGGIGLMRWEEIRTIWIQSQALNAFMCIDVGDPEPYLAHLPWYRRWTAKANVALGFSPITLNFGLLYPGLEEAMAHIRSRYESSEDDLDLEVSATGVTLRGLMGPRLCVDFADIQLIGLARTADDRESVKPCWVFELPSGYCFIPGAVDRDNRMLRALQELPGFDVDAAARAMQATGAVEVECWRKPDAH